MTKNKYDPKYLDDFVDKVKEFHTTFNHPVLTIPTIAGEGRSKLRISLLKEELEELQDAIKKKDIVAVADAFCDLQYVLSGAILEFGLGEKFNELFDEVHRSNMSKACVTKGEALQTIEAYYINERVESYYEEKDGKFLVYRKVDNKTLKSINYSKADLKSILEL